MEPKCLCRIVLLDFGHPMNNNTIKNIINSLENVLALGLAFSKTMNDINFGILSLDSKLTILQSESNLRKNYKLITKNLRASTETTNGKVTVQEYKLLLRSSIETVLYEFHGKTVGNHDSEPNNPLIQFAIVTKKSASILDDILTDLMKKLQESTSSEVSVGNFKIVQILSELQEKTFRAPKKNSSIDWAFYSDDVNDLGCFFKDWLLNPHQELRILLSSDLNLKVNCYVNDCLLNPISCIFDGKSDSFNESQFINSSIYPDFLERVYELKVTHRLPVNGFCPTLVFGVPRRIYSTRSSGLNESELQKNSKIFTELCRELRRTGQGLLAKSLISRESDELISFHFLTSGKQAHQIRSFPHNYNSLKKITSTSVRVVQRVNILADGDMLLMNDVVPDELYFPEQTKLSKSADFSGDEKAAFMIKNCFQKIQFLDEYTPRNFSSGVYNYLKKHLTQVGQSKSVPGYFDSNTKLFERQRKRRGNPNVSSNSTAFTSKIERFINNECEKRKKKPGLGSGKKLKNVHPALLSPNIVLKYRKIHSEAFVLPELGKEYNDSLGKTVNVINEFKKLSN